MNSILFAKLGRTANVVVPKMPPEMPQGPPVASILDPLFRWWFIYRPKYVSSPPAGLCCIVGPRTAVCDDEFQVSVTFAPQRVDQYDAEQMQWWSTLSDAERKCLPVEIRLETTDAFKASPGQHII